MLSKILNVFTNGDNNTKDWPVDASQYSTDTSDLDRGRYHVAGEAFGQYGDALCYANQKSAKYIYDAVMNKNIEVK